MQKLGFPSMKSLDQFKSLSGSVKNFSFSSRPSSDSISMGSFTNLKLTAEKLVKEQASVKTDLEMANVKLKKSMEHIRALEGKLQNAFNENAKLKVKQKEDEKLWKGLESKFSSTKSLYDQLTETLHHLAGQVQDAENNKEFFEGKLAESSNAIDNLNQKLTDLSISLGSAEETISTRDKQLEELKTEKEETDKIYKEERCRTTNLMEEKDAMLKKFEATVAANRLAIENLKANLEELHHGLRLKEEEIKHLMTTQENLEKERGELQLTSNDISDKLAASLQEIKNLDGFIQVLASQLVEMDKQSCTLTNKFNQLNSLYDICFKLIEQERGLAVKCSQKQYDHLHDKFLSIQSEKDAVKLVNEELNSKIIELQKAQESVVAQLSDECHSTGERIRRLESEAEILMSKKKETEVLVSKLEERIGSLSETKRLSEIKVQDLLLQISTLEVENKDNEEKLQAEVLKKTGELDTLRKESEKHVQLIESLEKQVTQLQCILEEKEQHVLQCKDREKMLEAQISENQASLTAAENKLSEANKHNEMLLESKQLELSRHLKEISQRNDQAINEIRKKYEVEKLEIVSMEKAKADKLVQETEQKCDQKLAECKEESRHQLMRIQEERATLVLRIQQEHDEKETSLKTKHSEELKRSELEAENELREKTMQLRNEHEVQMKAIRCQFEDECRKIQEMLNLQKYKEEKQRALLQLQWKVMSDKPQEEPEVNSKKDCSVSSIKMRDPGGSKRGQHSVSRPGNEEKESAFLRASQTPVSTLLKKVENGNAGSVMAIPKHHKKVTHHEYEVETNNGRTITKRKKTRSTVMFDDSRKQKRTNTPKVVTPRTSVKRLKAGTKSRPSTNIGDLFSEGSLNPYADDPYAFD